MQKKKQVVVSFKTKPIIFDVEPTIDLIKELKVRRNKK